MVSVLFALLTALCNGLASVLQRMAASTAPAAKALHLSLFSYLIRRKVWLAGIGLVVLAAVCQAVALGTGAVALVQPIFIIELPFTLLVASRLAHRKLPQRTWWAVGLVTVSLGAGLAAAAPSGGTTQAPLKVWITALIVTGVFEAVVITVGVRTHGNARGAAFGLAAACGYALTATLMKSAVDNLSQGVAAFFSAWQLYATAGAGVGALFLLQNALQAGSLVAVQPPLTLGDALISASYGVTVFGEEVRTDGWLLVVEIAAVIAIAIGCIELSRSLAVMHEVQPAVLGCARQARRRLGALARSCDVVGQRGSFGLELVDTDLHHVADAHDPAQAAVSHDRRVPHPVLGHHAHDLLDRGPRRDRAYLGCVDSRDRLRHRRRASLGERPDDVPLTGDPVDRGAVVGDDDSADPVLGEHREKLPHLGVRGDGDDLRTLDAKYIADKHSALPVVVPGPIASPHPQGYYVSWQWPGRRPPARGDELASYAAEVRVTPHP